MFRTALLHADRDGLTLDKPNVCSVYSIILPRDLKRSG